MILYNVLLVIGLSLDVHSFELVDHETTMSTEDFYNRDKVIATYYNEVQELVKKVRKFDEKVSTTKICMSKTQNCEIKFL